ncbi:glycosyltransferase family 87 protein [Dongia sp. agr-C8]
MADQRIIPWFIAAAALVTILFFGNELYLRHATSQGRILANDYAIYRFASQLLWQGDLATLFDPQKFLAAHEAALRTEVGFAPFPYMPSALWVVAPLEYLPGFLGPLIWLGLPAAALVWLVARRATRPWHAATALLLAPAALDNIAAGQNGFLAGALLCGGLLLLRTRPLLAGVLIGLLSFKPQLGLLLPFVLIAGGHYRSFIIAAAVAIGLVLLSLLLFGLEPWRLYFEAALPSHRVFLESGGGFAILTMPSVFNAGRLLGLPTGINYLLQGVAAVATIAACSRLFSRRAIDLGLKLPVAMVGTFLVTPYCSAYDLAIVAAAQVLVLSRGGALPPGQRQLHAAAWLLPLLMIPLSLVHVPIGAPVLAALFWILLRRATASIGDAGPQP